MRSTLLVLAALGWLLAGGTVVAQPLLPQSEAEKQPDAALVAQIDRLIGQLDADTFDVRERASRDLAEIGWPALAALRKARQHASAEVRFRAKALVEALTVGVRRREFAQFCCLPDDKLDLEHGMWLIARILDPQVNQRDQTRQLDEIAARVRQRLGKGVEPATEDPQKVVAAVRQVLFVDDGFTGNVADYNHPDNSSLPRVLATKKGLPILLSHLTMAVARRLRVPIVGVPAPGRYLVKYDGAQAPAGFPQDDIFFTPFEAGRLLTEAERPAAVAAYTNREELTRMLRNLVSALDTREGMTDKRQQVQELLDLLAAHEQ